MRMILKCIEVSSWVLFFLNCCNAVEIPYFVEQLPTITSVNPKTQIAFPEDEEFQIKCNATGNPSPTYQWTKDGKPYDPFTDPNVRTKNNSGTFILHNVANITSYNGTYRCDASNKLGTAISEKTTFLVPGNTPFPKEHIPPITVEEGEYVVLPCDPPTGIPPIKFHWMSVNLIQIPQDSRVSVGQNGNLYFANVKFSDSTQDYYCHVAFNSIRRIYQKMPMKLIVLPSESPRERAPKILTPHGKRSSVTVLTGDLLELECIAEGLPTPTIAWMKGKEPFPEERAITENYGNIIKIQNVSEADEGVYQCVAYNKLGSVYHDFHVHIEEPPRWNEIPESSVLNVGSKVDLRCSAFGKPEPNITWKINGKTLEYGVLPSNYHIKDKEISISNLQVIDSGVYQCEASNDHGILLTSANIHVLDIPPVILTPDDKTYISVQGHDVYLYCDVFSFPPANIMWNRDESVQQLIGGRYNMLENGTLQIKDTKEQDAGTYTCWVTNARGKAAITANLVLREPTIVSLLPENPRVQRSHRVTLTCPIQCDEHLLPSLIITWKKDGQILTKSNQRIHINYDSLWISGVTMEDEGIYSCSGETALDSVTVETHLSVQDLPSPPEHLQLSEKLGNSVLLSWTPGNNHNSPITEIIIQSQKSRHDLGDWEDITSVPGNETSALLTLIPYLHYRFRVIAVNKIGKSSPSDPSERYSTPPSVPDRNPEVVYLENTKPNELTVKWEPLGPEEHNGPGMEYRVSWRHQGVETNWHHEKVKHPQFTIKNIPAFAPYEIRIQAVNEMGAGPEPSVHTEYSGEDTPDAAPQDVRVEVLNSSLTKVTWTGITQDRVRGHLTGYKLIYKKNRNLLDGRKHHSGSYVLVFPGQKTWGLIPKLDPFCEYQVSVVAFNTQGDGPESTPVIFHTSEGVPEQPHFLRIMNSDQNSLTLSWGPPRKVNGILTHYLLQHQIINDTDEVGTLRIINITNPSTVNWRIPHLHGATKYKFYLKACTSMGCGKSVSEEGLTVTQATYAVVAHDISTKGWFIGLLCAVALLTLTMLIACFVQKNKGGKYAVKEKEDLQTEIEVQPVEDEIFDEQYSDKKPLNGSQESFSTDIIKACESMDSLAQYSDGDQQFNEDGSFIGAYNEAKEKNYVDINSTTIYSLHS
ncbi:neural cell adhesion molecule L1-like protein [Bombina bombina]|uniref:neural cell adhesion molecule L1-like protein n=1 Tax=Bombina bombina TaxID=8345 RepID=UPI00235B26AA|nr:neural cell adhesion molecule L1-like protein [Bombina bombina]XP_053576908.1 neural cell adhesion molecule L1-like protein [Bombina bombina]XP_053576909.1 neural cell adhesion molecule L1-like protein [Bombina bombina]